MDRPSPEEYQPRLTVWSHLWRVAVMLSLSAAVWLPASEAQADYAEWWWTADLVLGLGAYVLVFFRRRWPFAVAVVLSLLGAVSGTAAGPATLAAVSLATHRRWRQIVVVGVLGFLAAQVFTIVTESTGDPLWLVTAANAIATAAMLAWGMYIGSRRELIWTLKHRAERAETEQELRVGQARATERARIAREMHDVLAHRISQISMHAGALAFREDLSASQMRESAALIREQAHEALTDLRGVLGVLRDGELAMAPQPTYADLADLVAEAQRSGLHLSFRDEVRTPDDVPDAVGRTIYRIVQEGITNAGKHAPGSTLSIELTGSPEEGVDVVMRNPLGFGSATPGAGLGLVGLAERAELRGGRLEHGRDGSTFVLRGWIPWAA